MSLPQFGIPTNLTILLDAVGGQLLAQNVVATAPQIVKGLRDDDELFYNPPAYPFITLTAEVFPANLAALGGGQSATRQYDGNLRISLWSLVGQDWAELDHPTLQAALYAEILLWQATDAALWQFMPYDINGNGLLIEAMRNTSWKPSQPRPDRKGWIKFVGIYSIRFVQSLT
jgi:hypothetical protein